MKHESTLEQFIGHDVLQLIDPLQRCISASGITAGLVNVQALHTTTAIVINEHERLPKLQNLNRNYGDAIRRLHDCGVMINGSFVFGMDHDDEGVFGRTVEWAVAQGIETATSWHRPLSTHARTGPHDDNALGICSTRDMPSFVRPECHLPRSKQGTVALIGSSIAGARFFAARARTTQSVLVCDTRRSLA